MTWAGLTKKGVMVLRPDEWNAVIDALDTLKVDIDTLESSVNDYSQKLDQIISIVSQPTTLEAASIDVTTIAAPLSTTSKPVKRIHIKVPNNASLPVYVGTVASQDFRIEAGDLLTLHIDNASKVYVKSTGTVSIYVLYEV